jgi:uncharacterized SAM-binding protein YcdF (DUF218 family)
MNKVDPCQRAAAERVHAYLSVTDPLPATPADAVLGFGMFDLRLPNYCGELYTRGHARRIIFTGGIGAGTGRLGGPEADAWPAIPPEAFITENQSTNTAENILFIAALLARVHPALAFGRGIRRVILVGSPSRLRRAELTVRQRQPELECIRQHPPTSFEAECALYAENDVDYIGHLSGELDRLIAYPQRGWIAAEPLPAAIVEDHARLRAAR